MNIVKMLEPSVIKLIEDTAKELSLAVPEPEREGFKETYIGLMTEFHEGSMKALLQFEGTCNDLLGFNDFEERRMIPVQSSALYKISNQFLQLMGSTLSYEVRTEMHKTLNELGTLARNIAAECQMMQEKHLLLNGTKKLLS